MRLKVSVTDELLFDLELIDGRLQYHYVKDTLQTAIFRWVQYGVDDWVQDGPERWDCHPETIYIDHPQFLSKLKCIWKNNFPSSTS